MSNLIQDCFNNAFI